MPGSYGPGSQSVVGYALETTARTYVAPAYWLFPDGNTTDFKPDIVSKDLMSGSVAANRVVRPGKFQNVLPLTYPLFSVMGAPLLKAGFGANTGLTALTADTVKAATPITTTGGVSTITLTNTGAVSYTVGAWVQVNTTTSSELRQINTITGNGAPSTVLTVGALVTNAAAAAGTAVQQVAQIKFTTAPTGATLPTVSVENNEGNQYSEKLAGCLVEKQNLKFGKDEVQVSTDLFATTMPVLLTSPTTPVPESGLLADLSHPFTSTDTQFCVPADPTNSGSSTLQMFTDVETAEIDWQNILVKKALHDQQQSYRGFRGKQGLMIKYHYANEAKRPAELSDYLMSLQNTTAPFFGGAALYTGSSWVAWGMYVPTMVYTVAKQNRSVADVITADIEARAIDQTQSGGLCSVFVCNAAGSTAY